jgi:hypothetical protein
LFHHRNQVLNLFIALKQKTGDSSRVSQLSNSVSSIIQYIRDAVVEQYTFIRKEIDEEIFKFDGGGAIAFVRENWRNFIHVPYLPCLSKPGWMLR